MKPLSDPYDIAVNFIKFRPRSVKEVADKLARKKIDPDKIEATIVRLKNEHFLDDAAFAGLWVRNRLATKPEGKYLVKRELQQKGITADQIERALNENYTLAEDEVIKELLRPRVDFENLNDPKKRKRIISWLSRRGFGYQTIKLALDSDEI